MNKFRLSIGRWQQAGLYEPQLQWTPIYGLEMPNRSTLEGLALEVLRLPGVVAVRIDELTEVGNQIVYSLPEQSNGPR